MSNDNKIGKRNMLMVILATACSTSIMMLYFLGIDFSGIFIADSIRISESIFVSAQMNSPNGSSITILGDIVIPSNSNGTMTTAVPDGNDTNAPSTSINKTRVAQNATSAVEILKEDRTFPISPTGISTEGLTQPPGHRILNNSNIPLSK